MSKITVDLGDGNIFEREVEPELAGKIAYEATKAIGCNAFLGVFLTIDNEHPLWGFVDTDAERMVSIDCLIEGMKDNKESIDPSLADLERYKDCSISNIILGEN